MRPFLRAGPWAAAILIAGVASSRSRGADSRLEMGDPHRGASVFQQNCELCHSNGQDGRPTNGQGPLLAGVMGRRAASLSEFGYTKALAQSGVTWTSAALDRFLSGPSAMVPGTAMAIVIANPVDRRDLVAYLGTLRPLAPAVGRIPPSRLRRVRTPGDWQNDFPGARHRIEIAELPRPYATLSAGNSPHTVRRPSWATPRVPAGFTVELFASGLAGPRLVRTAPNGDLFISETAHGRVRVLRAGSGANRPAVNTIFAESLQGPFGIAFYPLGPDPRWVYVATLNTVIRYPYRNGDLRARGPADTVVGLLADTTGGHTTRDVAFSADGRRLFVSVGSGSNVADGMPPKAPEEIRAWEMAHGFGAAWGYEANRADILVTDPEGREPLRAYATGLRNAVTIAVQPATGILWASTNERDGLGDDLVPDYITRVREGAWYGWPWYYMGDHEDPRHAGDRPDLKGRITNPDVPLQSHSAPLQMTFYPAHPDGPAAFPPEYRGDIFVALHGSWNRTGRTGSKVVRVRLRGGIPTGDYEDFLVGFVVDDARVWARPVGVSVARDGALIVTDDAAGTVWRVSPISATPCR